MSRVEERHTVPLAGGWLALVLHLPEGRQRVPCVVACHGLEASKDSKKYLLLGAQFPSRGLGLARFDFRGCGESSGRDDETTIASRVEDLAAVIECLAPHRRLDGRFALMGSSLGGYVALHVAAGRRDTPPVVTWNAPSRIDYLIERIDKDAPGVSRSLVREQLKGTYTEAPAGVPCHLVVQAEADELVPVEHGANLVARAAEPCDLVIIPGADHRFTDTRHRTAAVARSLEWFQRFLVSPE